jgi:L-lactate dehydrogenase complex protein LldF
MRHWREREFERHLTPATVRSGLKLWGYFAKRPTLYRLATAAVMGTLGFIGRDKGSFAWLPLSKGWTKYRNFPVPQGATFQQRWARERGRRRAS